MKNEHFQSFMQCKNNLCVKLIILSMLFSILALGASCSFCIFAMSAINKSAGASVGQVDKSKKESTDIPNSYAKAVKQLGLTKKDISAFEKQPSFEYLKATMPENPVKIMVGISLADYYNYGYRDDKYSHLSIGCYGFNTVTYLGGVVSYEKFGTGYIKRNSEGGKLLLEKLKDGKIHVAVISICYNYKSKSQGDIFKIDEVHEVRLR